MMYDIIWCMKSYVDVPGKPNQIHTNFIYDVCKCVCLCMFSVGNYVQLYLLT